jgi:hypothetical protein
MKTQKTVALGHHDFQRVIKENMYYVDKSLLIKEIVDSQNIVTLFTRPRRFGKTLNMMMLKYFFEINTDNKAYLFNDLLIAKEPDIMALQGKNPVIWLSFKDVKDRKFETSYEKILDELKTEYKRHDYLLKSDIIKEDDKSFCERIISKAGTVNDVEISIKSLCEFLELHYGIKPILLIDEYDSPINASYTNGYYQEMIEILRNMYSMALKDNIHLERAVLTGIYRVAKESIFSGLNNLEVASMLSVPFTDKFGFTETEVKSILHDYDIDAKISDVRNWYNGYIFGIDTVIYNPWSILKYVKDPSHSFEAHWINTSNNDIIKKMVADCDVEAKQDFEILLQGGTIEKRISEDVVYGTIDQTPDSIWSFFLFSGYLKITKHYLVEGKKYGVFQVPNLEIKTILSDSVSFWFEQSRSVHELDKLLKSLIKNNLKDFSKYFSEFITQVASYYDFADSKPERIYHALVLGMMVNLQSQYQLSSNKESGFGRYDIVLKPIKDSLKAYIFEFKKYDSDEEETIQETLTNAMNQIKTKEYASVLLQDGFNDIDLVAIAFKGKEVKMVWEKYEI